MQSWQRERAAVDNYSHAKELESCGSRGPSKIRQSTESQGCSEAQGALAPCLERDDGCPSKGHPPGNNALYLQKQAQANEVRRGSAVLKRPVMTGRERSTTSTEIKHLPPCQRKGGGKNETCYSPESKPTVDIGRAGTLR